MDVNTGAFAALLVAVGGIVLKFGPDLLKWLTGNKSNGSNGNGNGSSKYVPWEQHEKLCEARLQSYDVQFRATEQQLADIRIHEEKAGEELREMRRENAEYHRELLSILRR